MKVKQIISLLLAAAVCVCSFAVNASAAKTSDYTKMTAQEMADSITIGWNLGNTLDANDTGGLKSEIGWGNPKTTEKMILAVKKAGFNTIRIPVSWGKHIDEKNGKIAAAWLDRVQEVVDYAYKNGMFVILNSHHDRSWIKLDTASEKTVTQKLKSLWKQISERFKDYDERLMFEAMNEPNTDGSEYQWTGGTSSERKVLNRLYEAFVDTVRSGGGFNKTRFLLITPYGASWNYESMADLKLPNDDRIIVSVHSYAPSSVALDTYSSDKKLTESGKEEIEAAFSNIDDVFLSKGIPVIMTEFGTMNKSNTSERVKIAEYYLSVANQYGIHCCWWDNGSIAQGEGVEGFALLNRKTLKWYYPELVKALVNSTSKSDTVKIGGKSYKTSMKGLLDLTGKNLGDSDIKNLKYMTNLTEIILSDNHITDLSVLSNLKNLEKITFHNNRVSDLSFVKNLTKLKVIGAGGNGISDISALSKLKNLEELWLFDNKISDISALKSMKKLRRVSFSNNRLKSLTALSGSKLTELQASNNRLNGNLSALKGLTILDLLYLDGNGYEGETLAAYIDKNLFTDGDGFTYYY